MTWMKMKLHAELIFIWKVLHLQENSEMGYYMYWICATEKNTIKWAGAQDNWV